MDRLQLDLSLVKKEPTLDDYGHSSGNILDNIISESDFQDNFGHTGSSVPNSEADMDCGVDWLSSFFDEPSHDNIHGFGPPLSELPTSVHCITSGSLKLSSVDTSHHESKALLVDTLNSFPDDYSNDIIYKSPNSIRPPSPGFPGNPLLSQMDELQKSSSEQDLSVDPSRGSPNLLLTDKISPNESRLCDNTIGLSDHIGLSRPPPRILAATVVSSDTRNNLQNGNSRQTQSVLNTVLSTRIKGSDDMTESLICQTQKNQFHVNSNVVSELLSTGLLTGMIKKEQENRENDSGCNGSHLTRLSTHHDFANLRNSRPFCYESTSQSPLAPPSPQGVHAEQLESQQDAMSTSSAETPTGDTPQERAPFFLTEEERRTLIAEGLPIPAGLPLTKLEERALKKVRRKIKNKISAQESRRKKKEYMEALEKKVEGFTADNTNLKKKTETLEAANRSLIIQVQKLQALLATKVTKSLTTRATQIP